jgi:hypothetical protein
MTTLVPITALAAFLIGVPGAIHAQSVKLIGPARVTLDPVCNAGSGASFIVHLRNEAAAQAPLVLLAEATPKAGAKAAFGQIAVAPLDASGRVAKAKTALAKDEVVTARIDLGGTLEAGEWEIDVRNAGSSAGKVTAVVPQTSFAVKPEGADNAEALLQKGRPATIALVSEDSHGHFVSGNLNVRGISTAAKAIPIAAKGGGELTFTPPNEWFPTGLRALFRDDAAEARLTLRFHSNACLEDIAPPARVHRLKAALAAKQAPERDFWLHWVLLGTLVLGGVASLAMNLLLPANARRSRARTQLAFLARRIDDIPVHTDSRVRTSLAVERRQLAERLSRAKWWHSQFSLEMTEIEQALGGVHKRIGVIAEMELVLNKYWRQRSGRLPFLVADEIEELRIQFTDLLKRSQLSDADVQTAQGLIKRIDERIRNAIGIDSELAARLARKIPDLKKDFDPEKGDIGTSPVWAALRDDLAENFDCAIGPTAPTDVDKIAPADYVRLGRAVFILDIIRDFMRLCGATGPTGALKPEQRQRRDALMISIRSGSWEQMRRASRLVRKLRERIGNEEVEKEVQEGRVEITCGNVVARQFEPVELRVVFRNKAVQASAAREEYTCHWAFEHGNTKLLVTGWSVSHFFLEATEPEGPDVGEADQAWLQKNWRRTIYRPYEFAGKHYKVTVTLVRDDGVTVSGMITHEVKVRPPLPMKVSNSRLAETMRFLLALGIAAAALIIGAREQIIKLDVFPALITVFLLGFGSDRIKNMIAERAQQQSLEPPKPPVAP